VTYPGTLCDVRIPWSQWSARDHIADLTAGETPSDWPFGSERHEQWGPRAKWLLAAWLDHLNLDRSDVITVLTTSQERYVAIDVSITSFNFASVSRAISDRTRVIIVIHELGYVDTSFPDRCEEWRARGIKVLEDCAHVAGVSVGPGKVGDFGDAALFSLCKIIPARVGGLIRMRSPFELPPMSEVQASATVEGKASAKELFPYLSRINAMREERHMLLRQELELEPWEPEPLTVSAPLYSVYTDREHRIQKAEFPNVDWGQTTIEPDRIQIPTNPLVPLSEYKALAAHVRS
jgi:hypothetical protein